MKYQSYNEPEEAQAAVKNMDGKNFEGSKLKVEIAGKPKNSKGPKPED